MDRKVLGSYKYDERMLILLELILRRTAHRTCPIVGNILPFCARGNIVFGIPGFLVIDVSADGTGVLFHELFLLISTLPD